MGGGVWLVPTPIVIKFKLKNRQNTALDLVRTYSLKLTACIKKRYLAQKNEFIFYLEAVPSINYIGRQLDVFYIGRQIYGEIIYQIRPAKVGAPHAHFL